MANSTDIICYLCGLPGADSKDHVPPKCLLPENEYRGYQRVTVPAHRACNSAASDDEEYLRDLLVQEAVALNLPKTEVLNDKVWRAWAKPGWKRYQRFMKTAIPVEKRTPGGLYAGKAVGIVPEVDRIKAVCRKIARGIIYHDSGAVLQDSEVTAAPLSLSDAMKERQSNRGESFWIGMSSPSCLHNTCADTVALRRFYEGVPVAANEVVIVVHVAIMLWNLFAVCSGTFPLGRIARPDFKFAINTENGTWVRGDSAST